MLSFRSQLRASRKRGWRPFFIDDIAADSGAARGAGYFGRLLSGEFFQGEPDRDSRRGFEQQAGKGNRQLGLKLVGVMDNGLALDRKSDVERKRIEKGGAGR